MGDTRDKPWGHTGFKEHSQHCSPGAPRGSEAELHPSGYVNKTFSDILGRAFCPIAHHPSPVLCPGLPVLPPAQGCICQHKVRSRAEHPKMSGTCRAGQRLEEERV